VVGGMGGSGGTERPAASAVDVFLSGLAFYDVVFTGLDAPPAPGTEVWAGGLGSGPGGIANFAVTLRRLGLTASLAAAFGDDPHGELCRRELAADGVDLSGSRWFPGWRTPVTVALAYAGDRALVTHGAPPPVDVDDLVGEPPRSRATIVHLGPEPVRWLGTAAAAGSLVFADVGWDPSQEWPGDLLDRLAVCHAFMPNADEAMAYTRTGDPRAALGRLADVVPLAVVTLGRDGAIAVDATTGEAATVPAVPVDVVDTTGAGDVFGACLVAATLMLPEARPLVERLRFAALGAGLSLRRPGGAAAAPSWHDVAQWWEATRRRPAGDALRRDYGFLDDVLPRGNTGHPAPALAGD
jgi:sugar/nucleoside kinase (ribokinase family)